MRRVDGMTATLPEGQKKRISQPDEVSTQMLGAGEANASYSRFVFAKNRVIFVMAAVLLAAALSVWLRSGDQLTGQSNVLNFLGRLVSPVVQEAPSATQWGCWEETGQGGTGNCVAPACERNPCPLPH